MAANGHQSLIIAISLAISGIKLELGVVLYVLKYEEFNAIIILMKEMKIKLYQPKMR